MYNTDFFSLVPICELQNEKVFPEPQLVIFINQKSMNGAQRVLVADKEILLSIEKFTVNKGLTLLTAAYYVFFVSYPKFQEFLLQIKDTSVRHSARYKSFVNALL